MGMWTGRTSTWFRGTQDRHEGRIYAGGVEKDVDFAEADVDVHDAIDAAYRTKYERYRAARIPPTKPHVSGLRGREPPMYDD